ncbi:MAG: SWIB/MDM2 domain-containing protein [Pseudomonadota bacterium]
MATAPKASATSRSAPASKRAPNSAFWKPLTPSPVLAAVIGVTPLPRTDVMKKLWEYIKSHKLQDPADGRTIKADAKLTAVFGKPQVSMFEMTSLISKHLN